MQVENSCPFLDIDAPGSSDESSIEPPFSFRSSSPAIENGSDGISIPAPTVRGKCAAPSDLAVVPDEGPELILDESRMARMSSLERKRLKVEAESLEHLMTHEPMNPFCLDCMRAKMQLAQSRKASSRGASLGPRPEKFGDQVTCDHLLAQDVDDVGMDDESCALVLLDRGTDYIDAIPQPERTAACCYMALLEFAGPYDYINELYSDGAPELVKAAKDAKWIHSTSAPERPQKNGVAERAVRSVKAGGRTVLLKAGLPAKFWPKAIRH